MKHAAQNQALAISMGLFVGSLWLLQSLATASPADVPRSDPVPMPTSRCEAVITRTLAPSQIRTCESCGVGLELQPRCPEEPLNVVLVLWGYANAFYNEARLDSVWTEAAIDALSMSENPHVQVGIVYVRAQAQILLDLTNNETDVRGRSRVERVNVGAKPGDWPCYSCGFDKAAQILRKEDPKRSVIVYIGGMIDFPLIARDDDSFHRDWLKGASTAKRAADIFVVSCPWVFSCDQYSTRPWWRAASPGYYFDGPVPGAFGRALADLVRDSLPITVESFVIDEAVPEVLDLVAGSAWPAPALADAALGRVRWSFTAPMSEVVTLTYRVQPQRVMTTSFDTGTVVLTDTTGASSLIPIPSAALTVTELCETPTPTATTIPPTVTDVPPPPTEPPPTEPPPTATPTLGPVYLPLVLNEQCVVGQTHIDVVLAVDASTSMLQEIGNGRTKLDAARDAAAGFLGQLGASDQAAVVAFNREATLMQPLTTNRIALDGALANIEAAQQTCLPCAIDVAVDELRSDRRNSDNTPVLILLTDGKSNPRPASEAEGRAAEAKQRGVIIFTIGLGDDLDFEALAHIASKPDYYYHAPDAEELSDIYEAIAVEIPCPAEDYWGRRR